MGKSLSIVALTGKQWGAIGAGLAIGAGIVVLLIFAARHPKRPRIKQLGPSFFFWLGLIYLGLLLLMAVAYNSNFYGLKDQVADPVGGVLPIGVPWFGALGAVVISLEGLFQHNARWDRTYNYWHIARPLFGAVLGIVAFFLFVLIMSAAGNPPKFLTATPTAAAPSDLIIYFVVAFLVGYRESTFRELIKRATDLVLQPGGPTQAAAPSVEFHVAGAATTSLDFGQVALGQTSTQTVEVHNTGGAPVTAPAVAVQTTDPDGAVAFAAAADAVTGGGDLAPGDSRTVNVTFSPAAAGAFAGELVLTSSALTDPAVLDLTGTGT